MTETNATDGIDWTRPPVGMKVLLADDQALYRDLIVQVLQKAHEDVTVIEARNFAEALQIAMAHDDLTLAVVDLIMPGMDGFAGVAALRYRLPEVPIVVVSALSRPRHVHQAYDHGANGFVPKTANSKVLLDALGVVLSGGIYVPPEALDLSEPTIKLHVSALFKELGVTNRTQAAVRATKLGLFPSPRIDP